MADYKKIFFAIDKDRNHYIKINDLDEYARANKMNATIVQRWIRLFDPTGSGKITLEKFCETLGEDIHDIQQQYPAQKVQQIKLIQREMTDRMVEEILNVTRECVQQHPANLQAQAAAIKEFAEKRFGDSWHCFIVNGSHGFYYSHKPNHSISFCFGGTYFFVFCTPL